MAVTAEPRAPLGVRIIVAYKLGKAALQASSAVALWLAVRAGFALHLTHLAIAFGDHAVHPLSIRLARWLSVFATPGHLNVVALLLGADSIASAVEGWALRGGKRWGRWLIVVTTSALVPVEIYEVLRRPRLARIVVLAINVAIVGYLIYRLRRERPPTSLVPAPRPPPVPPSP